MFSSQISFSVGWPGAASRFVALDITALAAKDAQANDRPMRSNKNKIICGFAGMPYFAKIHQLKRTRMSSTDLTRSIQNWLQGDEKEFTSLFYHYHVGLSKFSERFLSDPLSVEELVMNVLLKVWKAKDRITDASGFNAYLYRAMRNELISFFRQKKPMLSSLDAAVPEPSVDAENEYLTLQMDYDACIEKLPPRRKLIFLMSRKQGMTYSQIASELDISLHTVQKQAGAAIQTIRKELNV